MVNLFVAKEKAKIEENDKKILEGNLKDFYGPEEIEEIFKLYSISDSGYYDWYNNQQKRVISEIKDNFKDENSVNEENDSVISTSLFGISILYSKFKDNLFKIKNRYFRDFLLFLRDEKNLNLEEIISVIKIININSPMSGHPCLLDSEFLTLKSKWQKKMKEIINEFLEKFPNIQNFYVIEMKKFFMEEDLSNSVKQKLMLSFPTVIKDPKYFSYYYSIMKRSISQYRSLPFSYFNTIKCLDPILLGKEKTILNEDIETIFEEFIKEFMQLSTGKRNFILQEYSYKIESEHFSEEKERDLLFKFLKSLGSSRLKNSTLKLFVEKFLNKRRMRIFEIKLDDFQNKLLSEDINRKDVFLSVILDNLL